VKDAADLTRDIDGLAPGEKVEITFVRDGAEKIVTLTLGSLKSEQTANADLSTSESALKLGVQLAPSSAKGDDKPGVVIVSVDPNGGLARAKAWRTET